MRDGDDELEPDAASEAGAGPEAPASGAGAAIEAPAKPGAYSGTLYAPGTFARSTPGPPPIYRVPGGVRRSQEWIDVDIRIRAAASSADLMEIVTQDLPRFDVGNVVIAFTTAAKLDDGHDMATLLPFPAWNALRDRLIDCAESLEPRGMSMSAYAAARFVWGDEELFARLARAGTRRAADAGPTDIAKGVWAFAKLRFVDEPFSVDFWTAMTREAARGVRNARFVDVSMIAWAFSMVGCGNRGLFEEVGFATRAVCDTLPPRSLAGISYACAKGSYSDSRLFAEIADRAMVVADEFGSHDTAAIVWAFSAAGVAHRQLFETLAAKIVASGQLRKLSPPLAAELAWGFATAGTSSPELYKGLEELCLASMQEFETEDVTHFAWSLATVGRRNPAVFRAIAAYADRFVGRLRPTEVRILAWALDAAGCGSSDALRRRLEAEGG
mmetsp:Transcript_82918/g.243107  ORF Transcript_82918/g.243107 Transcript_82918/m.243107 type:complete len:442 (+) Transcript_82918:104-1429(+)